MFFKRLKPYFDVWALVKKRYQHPLRDMSVLFTILIFYTLLSVGLPYVLKEIVNIATNSSTQVSIENLLNWQNLYFLAITYALGWLLMHIFNQIQNIVSAFFTTQIETGLVYKGLENYFKLSFTEQKKIETGVLNTDVWRGAHAFSQITYTVLFILIPIFLQIIFMVWVLSQSISLNFALYFMLFALISFLINIFITLKSNDIFTDLYDAHNGINQFFIEKVQSNYDIRVNGALDYEMEIFGRNVQNYGKEVIKNHRKLNFYMFIQILFVGIFLLVFMLFTVYLFGKNQVTTGDFVLISTYIVALTMPLLLVSQSIIRLKGDFIAVKKFSEYFQIDQAQTKHESIEQNTVFYQFKNAQFYLGKNCISNFSFTIEQGECYVAMGQTGIGKTSFINYLIGLEHISQGQLFYKNIDISQQFSETIFQEIAVVSQLPIIYSGTLRQNLIHNSRFTYTDLELEQWLGQFNLLNLLRKNNLTLDDDLQNVYKSFSGGEKQRISMIRALLKQPKFLIMDEPTAALDEQTSMQLMALIRAKVETIFMISHAQYTKNFADEIIDFDQLILEQKQTND